MCSQSPEAPPASCLPHLSRQRSRIRSSHVAEMMEDIWCMFLQFSFSLLEYLFKARVSKFSSVKGQIASILGFQCKRQCPQLIKQP